MLQSTCMFWVVLVNHYDRNTQSYKNSDTEWYSKKNMGFGAESWLCYLLCIYSLESNSRCSKSKVGNSKYSMGTNVTMNEVSQDKKSSILLTQTCFACTLVSRNILKKHALIFLVTHSSESYFLIFDKRPKLEKNISPL